MLDNSWFIYRDGKAYRYELCGFIYSNLEVCTMPYYRFEDKTSVNYAIEENEVQMFLNRGGVEGALARIIGAACHNTELWENIDMEEFEGGLLIYLLGDR